MHVSLCRRNHGGFQVIYECVEFDGRLDDLVRSQR
ncbi:hypothetical protein ACHAWX_005539 [Stephanocyclus meneghinianus]